MENKDISQIVIERIKESGIKPISKNVFNLKRVLFWSLVGLSIVIGAISFSVTMSILLDNDWYLFDKFGFNFIFRTLPYFWLVFLVIFTILGDFYYRKTLLGYRHRTITIVGIYILLTISFGSILYAVGFGDTVEESLSENVSIYRGVMFDRHEFWSHPEDGLFFGSIIVVDGNLIKVRDDENKIWNVKIESASIGGNVQIQKGALIRIFGEVEKDGIIGAKQIRPWRSNNFNQVNQKFEIK